MPRMSRRWRNAAIFMTALGFIVPVYRSASLASATLNAVIWFGIVFVVFLATYAIRSVAGRKYGVFEVEARSYSEAADLAEAEARRVGFKDPGVDNWAPADGLTDADRWLDGSRRKVRVAVASHRPQRAQPRGGGAPPGE